MQETRRSGRMGRAAALAAALGIALWAAAPASAVEPTATRGDDGAGVGAAFEALVAVVGDWVAKIGCEIDPWGAPCTKTMPTADLGCEIDPWGHACRQPTATTQGGNTCEQTQPGQPTTDIGCEIDPWG